MITPARAPRPQALAPPRGAAIAGVTFSVLMIVSLGLVRYAMPDDMTTPDPWLIEQERREALGLALDLVPFAGIAFLWFVGVLRSRLGELEDQFFATVFLGSGLLFVASLFGAAAVLHALVQALSAGKISSDTYYFGHRMSDALFNIFAIKMAGVFVISTCTIGLRTAIIPRWIAIIGYACALVLMLVIANWKWITFVFPLWMLLVSTYILWADFRSRHAAAASETSFL
jgi:hypothetical protein